MSPAIATVCCVFMVLGLFWLDRDKEGRTSVALWIPVVWLWLACSRMISGWLITEPDVGKSADQVVDGTPVDRLVLSGLLAVGLVILFSRRKQAAKLLRANTCIIVFLAYCAVSLLWSDFPGVAFKRWIRNVADLTMILIVLSDRDPLTATQRVLARLSYILIPLSILLIKYYPALGVNYGPWGGVADYAGVANNKNSLGAICLCFGVGALWRFLTACRSREAIGRTRHMIAQGVVLAMVMYLFGKINAVTATSTLVMASLLLLISNLRAVVRRPAIVHLAIAAMLAVSVCVVFFGASPGALEAMGRNSTLTDRTAVWGVLLSQAQSPWLGTGFESFWLGPRLEMLWRRYWWHPGQAHNGYLEIFINLGWVGILLLAVILARGYRSAFRTWRNRLPMGSLRLAYIFVGLVFNFTEAAFFRMQAPVWVFLLFGLVNVPPVSNRKTEPTDRNLFRHSTAMDWHVVLPIRCDDLICKPFSGSVPRSPSSGPQMQI